MTELTRISEIESKKNFKKLASFIVHVLNVNVLYRHLTTSRPLKNWDSPEVATIKKHFFKKGIKVLTVNYTLNIKVTQTKVLLLSQKQHTCAHICESMYSCR